MLKLNENKDIAASYLAGMALKSKKEENPSNKISPEEVSAILKSKGYKDVINVLTFQTDEDNRKKDLRKPTLTKYIGVFTKMRIQAVEIADTKKKYEYTVKVNNTEYGFIGGVSVSELSTIRDLLVRVETLISKIEPQLYIKDAVIPNSKIAEPLDYFTRVNITEDGITSEKLAEFFGDALRNLLPYLSYTKYYHELSSALSNELSKSPNKVKDEFKSLAFLLDQIGVDDKDYLSINNKVRNTFHMQLHKLGKTYKATIDISMVIARMKKLVNEFGNMGIDVILQRIDEINYQFGELNGVDIIHHIDDFLIVNIKTAIASSKLNAGLGLNHCISLPDGINENNWESYMQPNNDKTFNQCFYLYDFSLDVTDSLSVIGLCLNQDCQSVGGGAVGDRNNDGSFWKSSRFTELLASYGLTTTTAFPPMTSKQKQDKINRIRWNKLVIKPNVTLDELKEAIANGADVNAYGATPLRNAISRCDYNMVEYLLKAGALIRILESKLTTSVMSLMYGQEDNDNYYKIFKLLFMNDASLSKEDISLAYKNDEVLQFLLDNNFNVKLADYQIVVISAMTRNFKMLDQILKKDYLSDNDLSMILKRTLRYDGGDIGPIDLATFKYVMDRIKVISKELPGFYTFIAYTTVYFTSSRGGDIKALDKPYYSKTLDLGKIEDYLISIAGEPIPGSLLRSVIDRDDFIKEYKTNEAIKILIEREKQTTKS